ncbi:MAG: hypothetical protein LBV30_07915 [Propionibacteriaceae bacterium]|jgi:hypothetical protein|nr:hypothetical protein [Propionibacteriaceae bacterium]
MTGTVHDSNIERANQVRRLPGYAQGYADAETIYGGQVCELRRLTRDMAATITKQEQELRATQQQLTSTLGDLVTARSLINWQAEQ